MPITSAAKKAMRHSKSRQALNFAVRRRYKASIKAVNDAVKANAGEEKLKELLNKAYSEIDRAYKKNLLHKNTAARKKSYLSRVVKSGKVMSSMPKAAKKVAKAEKEDISTPEAVE